MGAQKDDVKAYTDKEKKISSNEELLAKSRMSEAKSKFRDAKSKVNKAVEAREQAGKVARESTAKSARKAGDHVKSLEEAKAAANQNLVTARRARAEVYKEKAIQQEHADREYASKADGKEADTKNRIGSANKVSQQAEKHAKVNAKLEQADLTEAEERNTKTKNYDDTHLEKFEKDVQLSKQRVHKLIQEDKTVDQKLA